MLKNIFLLEMVLDSNEHSVQFFCVNRHSKRVNTKWISNDRLVEIIFSLSLPLPLKHTHTHTHTHTQTDIAQQARHSLFQRNPLSYDVCTYSRDNSTWETHTQLLIFSLLFCIYILTSAFPIVSLTVVCSTCFMNWATQSDRYFLGGSY